jgi:tripartite-type tricarboxylate transporter receptor subunit TctC
MAMRFKITCLVFSALTVGVSLIACGSVSAQSVDSFYKSTNLTIVVGSGAGGGYDIYTRVLARTLPNYIPGNPHIVVQNMLGASGIKALNHIYSIAPKDGSVISATFNTLPTDPLFGGKGGQYDAEKLSWIGSIGKQVNICISWGSNSFKTFDDVFQREMTLASGGAVGWRSILPRMYNALAGSKFKVIEGYGTNDMLPAVEKGEVDGICTTYETLQTTEPDWIQNRRITFLAQFGFKPIPDLKDVPMGLARIKDPDDLKAVRLILLQQEFGRPYVAPPAIPADRLIALRNAFDQTMKDKDFIANAAKTGMNIDPLTGQDIEQLIKQAYTAPKETIARASTILDRASK